MRGDIRPRPAAVKYERKNRREAYAAALAARLRLERINPLRRLGLGQVVGKGLGLMPLFRRRLAIGRLRERDKFCIRSHSILDAVA